MARGRCRADQKSELPVVLSTRYTIDNRLCLVEVLQGGCVMEGPTPSKRAATVGRYNGRESAGDGIRVDVKWQHQRIHKGGYQRRSIGTRMFFRSGSSSPFVPDGRMTTVVERRHQGVKLHA